MRRIRRTAIELALIAAAVILQTVPLPAAWIENDYANGIYAELARTFVPLANAVPFTIADVVVIALVLAIVRGGVRAARRPGSPVWLRLASTLLRLGAVAAVIAIWFDLGWALNYRRVPVIERVAYDRTRTTPASVAAFRASIVNDLNATAPLVHAHPPPADDAMCATLATLFAPVARRLGDTYDVVVTRPKVTLFDAWFEMAGIGGTWVPFTYETVINAGFLPFERPFITAHEWGHDAGFGDESDANLIAALTTLRSHDPFIRYSGLLWTYEFLPAAADRQRELRLSALVRADLEAARRRYLSRYVPLLSNLQWTLYDRYLRANRVAAGVVSYSLFVSVLVGTPLDAQGLPVLRSRAAAARTRPPRSHPPVALALPAPSHSAAALALPAPSQSAAALNRLPRSLRYVLASTGLKRSAFPR